MSEIERGARLLTEGGLVVFPTETVYGVGADARNDEACRRIFAAKGRPPDNPLILHVARIEQLHRLTEGAPPPPAVRALELFAPGPITVVFRHNGTVARTATTGLRTVAVRIPAHPIALELLSLADIPIAAPSANRSGRPSPTSYEMALEAMEGRVEAIIDGGECAVGVESTILDCTVEPQRILRPGGVTLEMLLDAGFDVAPPEDEAERRHGGEAAGSVESYRAPGSRYRHYTPEARVHVVESGDPSGRLVEFLNNAGANSVCLMGTAEEMDRLRISPTERRAVRRSVRFDSVDDLARGIYATFFAFDREGCSEVVAILPEPHGVGIAVRDRLCRAGTPL